MKEFLKLIASIDAPCTALYNLGVELWDAQDQEEIVKKAMGTREEKVLKEEMEKQLAQAEHILKTIKNKLEEI